MTRAKVGLVLGALALASALVLGGCGDPTPAATRRGQLLVVGDSLTIGARDFGDLEEKLTDEGWEPEIVAEEGVAPPWGLDRIAERERVPPVVVVGLGSNPSAFVGEFAGEVDAIVSALTARGARIVVWIPPVAADGTGYAERASVLREARAAHPSLRVPDWDATAAGRPDLFTEDQLHLTADGYGTLADFITEQLSS